MKIKLFYSYSQKDHQCRKALDKHLSVLRDKNIIDEWHDEKIVAGEDWNQAIENNMKSSHIILLLLSPDFIDSQACQKEVNMALKLKEKTGAVFIPIILRECSWKDINHISNIQALPKGGKPISQWDDKDSAWQSVYEGIKSQVKKMKDGFVPTLRDNLKTDLLQNPIIDATLDKLFVYPDILEINKSEQKLENNEIDSVKLKNITNFAHKYILIEGEEQSGKTSLCRMLYLHYADINFYPILLNGSNITGKADIINITNKAYDNQYSGKKYWSLPKEKRILIVDDINNRTANNKNYSAFLQSIMKYFEYAIVLIDKLSNLSDKSTEHHYFYPFNDYVIKSLGYRKRDELIKKCIEDDEGVAFSIENTKQVARLDKSTKHINTIIGSILPSYPVLIVSAFNIIESRSHDMTQTSYGHCYHAMITLKLHRINVRADDMDKYFKLLTEFSYFIFNAGKKFISENELNEFLIRYQKEYIFDIKTFENLIKSNIIIHHDCNYSFQYIYIYYYFVAKYIADKFNDDNDNIEKQVDKIMSTIHKKDSANIIVFITHHTQNQNLIDTILLYTMSIFDTFKEATLDIEETKFITEYIYKLKNIKLAPDNHNPDDTRKQQLTKQDALKPVVDKIENEVENQDDNLLLAEIIKSAKSLEIIGQIMRNQYGTFKKDKLHELFLEGQNVGLRLLKSFIEIMDNIESLAKFIEERLLYIKKEKKHNLSESEMKITSIQIATRFSYSVIFGWLHRIVDSIGYDQLITIADDVNQETNTTASHLINFSIHAWHTKNIDFKVLESLYKNFETDKHHTATYLLKDIVSRHVYMHKIDFKEKQKIKSLFGLDVKQQIAIQSKIK